MTKSNIPRSEATFKGYYTPYVKNLYLLTITKHQKLDYVLPCDIIQVIETLKSEIINFRILDFSFETSGLYSQLHFHCICSIDSFFKFKNYKSLYGFQLYWKTVTKLKGALNYIYKDTNKMPHLQDEILVLNQYTHSKALNGFI